MRLKESNLVLQVLVEEAGDPGRLLGRARDPELLGDAVGNFYVLITEARRVWAVGEGAVQPGRVIGAQNRV